MLSGIASNAHFINIMNRLNKHEYVFYVYLTNLTNQDLFNYTAVDVVLCVKRLPLKHNGAGYIFWSFGIIDLICIHLQIEFC